MIDKKEFESFVESFQKEPGKYTIQQLMEIGAKFKELPVKERNWEELHKQLGIYNFSPEAYRHRVERYLRKNESNEGKEYREAYTEKQKVRDWYNAYRRDIREEVRIENLKDEIKFAAEKFGKLEPIVWPEVKETPVEKTEAVLLVSDLHIGVDCDNYYNKYNKDIAKERLAKLQKNVINYCSINNVGVLNILNLGDLINGVIHTNARIEAQMDVAEQIMYAGELIANFLYGLSKEIPNITYRSVFDNHSRAIANKNEHIEKEQFSRVIDWFIAERLKDTPIEFIANDIDGGIGRMKLASGKTLMFCHGHNDGRNNSYQNFIGLTQEWVDYICMAHYHNPASKDFQGCKVFINGSIVGTESYAFGRRLFTKPSQKLIIFNEGNNNISDIDISLE